MNDFIESVSTLFFCFVLPITILVISFFVGNVFTDRSYQISKNETDAFWVFVLGFVNPVRQYFNKPKIWIIPDWGTSDLVTGRPISRANLLYIEIINVLEHTPISTEKKIAFQKQASLVPYNISRALWRQSRLSHLRYSIQHGTKRAEKSKYEIINMINNLDAEIERSLDTLTTVSVSLMSVELALSDLEIDRLFSELGNSNNRLRELSDTYKNAKSSQTG